MLWLCFKLPSYLFFSNIRDTFLMHEKAKFVGFSLYATAKSEIQIGSNKDETGLVKA